ncbi:hypothetical protein KW846_27960 [Pseudomonas sp. PDM32]|uniref:hypothetical protein n=1 Tax=Pseudomonas sp. PDM32 TaxID=2854768 RepID=UPI001C48FA0A|nr:hypothetical protein [Pseudomonas sp. PDM32]MBV7576560.1 hypothetical protein [Pseudomonas sp. PDM32]
MNNDVKLERSLDHAWRYFELHAQQRMTVFNFFLAISGLVAAGIGISLQQGMSFSFLVSLLGVFLSLISFLFWKLDQRVSLMIKNSEIALIALEKIATTSDASIFSSDQAQSKSTGLLSTWTYGKCFRISFMSVGLMGIVFAAIPYFINLSCKP